MRFPRRRRTSSWIVLAIVLVLLASRGLLTREGGEQVSFESGGPYLVQRVVDGDTLLLDGGERVRLLGVDTPETKKPDTPVDPLGLEAAEFTTKHVEGQRVLLKYDRERRDDYRRILAYVYLGDWFLNEELIREGYSRAETRHPYSELMKGRFRDAEAEAKAAKRGMWAEQQTGPREQKPARNSERGARN